MAQQERKRSGGLGRWLVRGLSRLLVLVVVFVAGAVAMHLGMHAGDREKIQHLEQQVLDQQAQLAQSQAQLAVLHSDADVQGGTQQALQEQVQRLQQELAHTRDQLAFYEQLIPPGPAGTVSIRAFDIQTEGDLLHYRVLLTRSAGESPESFKGHMRFVVTGLQDGKTAKMDLASPDASGTTGTTGTKAAPSSGADPLALDFGQFQRSAGVLQVPPGLTPQSVRLEILEGDTVRASRDVDVTNSAPAPGATHANH